MPTCRAPLLVFSLCLSLAVDVNVASAQQRPDNVRGNWTIYSHAGDGQDAVQHIQLNQNGNKISGHFEGPHQSGGLAGTINVHHIEFSTRTRDVLTFRGQVDGDAMQGNFGNRGVHGTWRAERIHP